MGRGGNILHQTLLRGSEHEQHNKNVAVVSRNINEHTPVDSDRRNDSGVNNWPFNLTKKLPWRLTAGPQEKTNTKQEPEPCCCCVTTNSPVNR